MSPTGRNEPCPCGSGKKYKKCCLATDQGSTRSVAMNDLQQDIHEMLADTEFSSLAEAQAHLDLFVSKRNAAPIEQFHGLSAGQMFSFLHHPFDTPELVQFNTSLIPEISAPVFTLFSLLLDAIGQDSLKATAKGNLPQKFCKEAAQSYWANEDQYYYPRINSARNEDAFYELHCLRTVAELAGMVRKYKGKFIIGTKYRKALAEQGAAKLFIELLKAHLTVFNWGYRDRYEEMPIVQQSFLFSLYLLGKYGDIERPQEFYEDAFIKAFPDALNELCDQQYLTAEDQLRNAYFLRTFTRCFKYFGLAELIPSRIEGRFDHYNVKKTTLLDQVVTFSL